jgi:hypothetical protein
MPRRHNRTGRSNDRFAALPFVVLDSPGYRSTPPSARALLVELLRLHNGSNNGRIGLSVRDAARLCCVSKDTASRAFQDLENSRLIETVDKGTFRRGGRMASTFRLCWLRCDVTGAGPTRHYMETGHGI